MAGRYDKNNHDDDDDDDRRNDRYNDDDDDDRDDAGDDGVMLGRLPPGTKRLVAIGDLHGDLQRFRSALRASGIVKLNGGLSSRIDNDDDDVVDNDLSGLQDRWIAPKGTVVVQMGDVIGRGADDEALLDYTRYLFHQAPPNSYINLIGNHEILQLYGDYRFVHPLSRQNDYRDDNSNDCCGSKQGEKKNDDDDDDNDWVLRRKRAFSGIDGPESHGAFIRQHFLTALIGFDTLFVHAGLLPETLRALKNCEDEEDEDEEDEDEVEEEEGEQGGEQGEDGRSVARKTGGLMDDGHSKSAVSHQGSHNSRRNARGTSRASLASCEEDPHELINRLNHNVRSVLSVGLPPPTSVLDDTEGTAKKTTEEKKKQHLGDFDQQHHHVIKSFDRRNRRSRHTAQSHDDDMESDTFHRVHRMQLDAIESNPLFGIRGPFIDRHQIGRARRAHFFHHEPFVKEKTTTTPATSPTASSFGERERGAKNNRHRPDTLAAVVTSEKSDQVKKVNQQQMPNVGVGRSQPSSLSAFDHPSDSVEYKFTCGELHETLDLLGVKRMIVGHTTEPSPRIGRYCNDQLICLDVRLSRWYNYKNFTTNTINSSAIKKTKQQNESQEGKRLTQTSHSLEPAVGHQLVKEGRKEKGEGESLSASAAVADFFLGKKGDSHHHAAVNKPPHSPPKKKSGDLHESQSTTVSPPFMPSSNDNKQQKKKVEEKYTGPPVVALEMTRRQTDEDGATIELNSIFDDRQDKTKEKKKKQNQGALFPDDDDFASGGPIEIGNENDNALWFLGDMDAEEGDHLIYSTSGHEKGEDDDENSNDWMDNIEGIVFDADGTLVDTMPLHYAGMADGFRHMGLEPYTIDRFYQLAGVPTPDVVRLLYAEQKNGAVAPDQFIADFRKFVHSKVPEKAKKVKPIDGVVRIAREAKRRGIPIAVATSGFRGNCDQYMAAAGLTELFPNPEEVVTSYDLPTDPVTGKRRGKPHPDIFIEAAKRIGVPPERCVAYEDGEAGLLSAKAAGMTVLDVRRMAGYPMHKALYEVMKKEDAAAQLTDSSEGPGRPETDESSTTTQTDQQHRQEHDTTAVTARGDDEDPNDVDDGRDDLSEIAAVDKNTVSYDDAEKKVTKRSSSSSSHDEGDTTSYSFNGISYSSTLRSTAATKSSPVTWLLRDRAAIDNPTTTRIAVAAGSASSHHFHSSVGPASSTAASGVRRHSSNSRSSTEWGVVAPLALMTFLLPLTALLHAISSPQRHSRRRSRRSEM